MVNQYRFSPLLEEDLDYLIEIRNEVSHMLHNDSRFTKRSAIEWFKATQPMFFLIYMNESKIGYFRTSNFDKVKKMIYVGADLHHTHRGKGYAHGAYLAFFDFLKEQFSILTVKLEVLSHNQIALHLYIKLGFEIINTQEKYCQRHGRWIDNILMRKTI
jgi:RimJ/RimL family protein N-acetyltransferase